MAATKKDELTVTTPVAEKKSGAPRVRVILPRLEDDGMGMTVDQYEHVTINGETTLIKRGEYADVTPAVYIQLKNRYPHL